MRNYGRTKGGTIPTNQTDRDKLTGYI